MLDPRPAVRQFFRPLVHPYVGLSVVRLFVQPSAGRCVSHPASVRLLYVPPFVRQFNRHTSAHSSVLPHVRLSGARPSAYERLFVH